jgi:hypothetical protein
LEFHSGHQFSAARAYRRRSAPECCVSLCQPAGRIGQSTGWETGRPEVMAHPDRDRCVSTLPKAGHLR